MPPTDRHQRRRHLRSYAAQPEEHGEGGQAENADAVTPAHVDRCWSTIAIAARRRSWSAVGVAGHAEQLRQLAGGHGEADADLDAGERRLRRCCRSGHRAAAVLATSRMAPTSSVSIARSPTGSVASAATPTAINVEPVKVATVDVVLIDRVREPPSRA